MSDALSYLLKVRPEAMKSYFDFLKASGKHLDPKTRAIISVITKVENQTEAGFRQYLKRARDTGVSADEVLDALLTAFPTLGLTKIIWAIDILLEMNIPAFNPDELGNQEAWHDVVEVQDLKDEEAVFIKRDGRCFFVYKNNEEIIVYDNRCPHQATNIPESALSDKELTCPKHGWKFNIINGECIEKGNQPLHRYEHKIEKDRLWVFY